MENHMNSLKLVLLTATILAMAFTQSFAQQKGSFTDPRDKKSYKTVAIGEQTWMAENLNYNAKGSKCYANKDANCKKYGQLYDEEAVKSVCPAGWHLPTKAEFDKLEAAAGGEETAHKFLKSKSGWNNDRDINGEEPNKMVSGNGEDKLGFTALPGGTYGSSTECGDECPSTFGFMGLCGLFAISEYYHGGFSLCSSSLSYYNIAHEFTLLFSVRCVKD
jgi:uncharacterized protein (TIGR02145 family)